MPVSVKVHRAISSSYKSAHTQTLGRAVRPGGIWTARGTTFLTRVKRTDLEQTNTLKGTLRIILDDTCAQNPKSLLNF